MPPNEFGTAQDYYEALVKLKRESISPKHLEMLEAHLAAPNHTATWADLAEAVGYSSYKIVNLQYGKFARRLADQLGIAEPPLADQFRGGFWLYVLVDWAHERGRLGHTAYVMRPPLVSALKRLGWRAPAATAPKHPAGSSPDAGSRTYNEGAPRDVVQTVRERDPRARGECLRHYGTTCSACGKSLDSIYGPVAADLIHVHHVAPLADADSGRATDPIRDLRPVCPNCHGVIHRREPPYSVDEVRAFIRSRGRDA